MTSLLRASASISRENDCSIDTGRHSRTPSGCSIMSLTSSSILSEPISENELETEDIKELNKSVPLSHNMIQNNVPKEANNSTSHNIDSKNVSNGLCASSAPDSEDSEDDNDKIIVCEKLENYEADSECSSDLSQNRVRNELDSKQFRDDPLVAPENGHRLENSDINNGLDGSLVNDCASTALKLKALHNRLELTTVSTSDQLSAVVLNPTPVCDDLG